MTIDRADSVRLHEDWWGKCRTCRFWQVTTTEGHCRQWDSFDVDVALETM